MSTTSTCRTSLCMLLSTLFVSQSHSHHIHPAQVKFVAEVDGIYTLKSLNGSIYPGSVKNSITNITGVRIPGACHQLVENTRALANSRKTNWVAIYSEPEQACNSSVFLEIGALAKTVSDNKLKGAILSAPVWKASWVKTFVSSMNVTVTIPMVVMDTPTPYFSLMANVSDDAAVTVAITANGSLFPIEPEETGHTYARTAVFVCFCIMSFCIMSMYCRIKISVMRENGVRNAIWTMAINESNNQEELMRRAQIASIIIDSMPTRVITTEEEAQGSAEEADVCCVICLDNYCEGDMIRTLPCSHEFHKSCIDPWMMERFTCPLCKYDIVKEILNDMEETETSTEVTSQVALSIDGDERDLDRTNTNAESNTRTTILSMINSIDDEAHLVHEEGYTFTHTSSLANTPTTINDHDSTVINISTDSSSSSHDLDDNSSDDGFMMMPIEPDNFGFTESSITNPNPTPYENRTETETETNNNYLYSRAISNLRPQRPTSAH